MVQTIKNQVRLLGRGWLTGVPIMFGVALFGGLLIQLIMRRVGDTDGYFEMGTMMGAITGAMFIAFETASNISIQFNMQIAMGCTRKRFFVSYYLTSMAGALLLAAALLMICRIETAVYAQLWPSAQAELEFGKMLIRYSVPAALALTAGGGCVGMLMMRFGKKVFWILWAVWMILSIGGPNITSAAEEAPDSVYGQIGLAVSRFVQSVPGGIWAAAGVLIVLASLAGAAVLMRKQQVNC